MSQKGRWPMHIYFIYVGLILRSFEFDKIAIDFVRAFIVELAAARAWKRLEDEA